jgi:3-deoxy-D-manno-octulosonic acid kinase
MNPVIHSENNHTIVYDADLIQEPQLCLFSEEFWKQKAAVTGEASGRGSALLLKTTFGPAVLRPYLRGGWAAKVSRDRYFFTGVARSRPVKEFNILKIMTEQGLPVPAPLAALVQRRAFSYNGALLMSRIEGVRPLSDFFGVVDSASFVWPKVGECIRGFHNAGVNHVDLNSNNILLNEQLRQVYVIDFDRCSLSPDRPVNGKFSLARLKRSWAKLWPEEKRTSLEKCWKALLDGYHG